MDFWIRILLPVKQPSPKEARDTDRRRRPMETGGEEEGGVAAAAGGYLDREGSPPALASVGRIWCGGDGGTHVII
jgi:hypothetical protein